MSAPLFHYTCAHGRRGIGKTGLAMPNANPLVPLLPLVWMTTDSGPDREANGLTSNFLACDRTAYRYRVTHTGACSPWLASRLRFQMGWLSWQFLADLETGRCPDQWWVSSVPVPIHLDRNPNP